MDQYELYHFGVKGMKWGVRKNRESSSTNKDYTGKQRKRDRALYGSGAEKRINKRLNKGHGLQGARHYEVKRKERTEKAKRIAKKGAKATARVLGVIGKLYIADLVYNGGAGAKVAKAGAKRAKEAALNKMYNSTILDKNGKPVHRYNQ